MGTRIFARKARLITWQGFEPCIVHMPRGNFRLNYIETQENGSTARYRADLAAALVAGPGEHRQTATRLASVGHQRLGEPDEERYSHGKRNRRADGCGRADVGGGVGRRDTGS